MRRCLALAKQGRGLVAPNPMVGAVLVDPRGNVLGEGFHERYGASHAEVNAIRHAEATCGVGTLQNATLYINLEPCNHEGNTPPCASLILSKHIRRVVIGMEDPNPRARGGMGRLRDRGVEVCSGILEDACRRLNEAFIHCVTTGRPLISAKIAQTLDGRVADARGASHWVSGLEARKRVHEWRASHRGVLVGAGTALHDDPSLTVRHVDGVSPARYVLDRNGLLPSYLKLFTDHHASRTAAIVRRGVVPQYSKTLTQAGGRILEVHEVSGHLDLAQVLTIIGTEDKIQSLLVEPGPGLLRGLLSKDLVDRMYIFLAPKLLGSGLLAVDDLPARSLTDAITFASVRWETVGQDILFSGHLRKP